MFCKMFDINKMCMNCEKWKHEKKDDFFMEKNLTFRQSESILSCEMNHRAT